MSGTRRAAPAPQTMSFAQAAEAAERMVQHYRSFQQLHEVLVAAVNAEAARGEMDRGAASARLAADAARGELVRVEEALAARRVEVDAALVDLEASEVRRADEARERADAEVEAHRLRVLAAIRTADEAVAHHEARTAAALAAADDAERRAGVVREEFERLRARLGV